MRITGKQTYAECVAEGRCPSCHLMLGADEECRLCSKCRLLHKQRLIARVNRGLCRRCANRATCGMLCSPCAEKDRLRSAERQSKLREAGLCQRCSKPAEKSHCAACSDVRAVLTKRRRQRLLAENLCVNCTAPAIPDRTLCPECAEKWAAKEARRQEDPKRRSDQRARAAQRKRDYAAIDRCNACGKCPPVEGKKLCERCAERSRVGARIAALKKRTKRLAAANKPNPAISSLDPGGIRKLFASKRGK